MKKGLVLLKVILLIGVIILLGGCSGSKLVLNGNVETLIYPHYSEISGKILELPVELGQKVKAGDLLVLIDNSNEQYVLDQLKETLIKREAVLSELLSGIKPEELKQGQNNVRLADIAHKNAQIVSRQAEENYENAQILFEAGGLSQQEVKRAKDQDDLAKAAASSAAIQLDNARQALALMQKGISQEKIDLAQADVALTQIQINQAEEGIEKCKIFAIHDGTIVSRNYLLGNIVSPGYNLLDLASDFEKHIVTYVPKKELSKISYGQEVLITSSGKEYKGKISFIDIKAQYIPRELQTSANKKKESVKIKIGLSSEKSLIIGEKVKVVIPY